MVMYAGVPRDRFRLTRNAMAPDYERLLRTQFKLRPLIDKQKFMAVSSDYELTRFQKNKFKTWLCSEITSEGYP